MRPLPLLEKISKKHDFNLMKSIEGFKQQNEVRSSKMNKLKYTLISKIEAVFQTIDMSLSEEDINLAR